MLALTATALLTVVAQAGASPEPASVRPVSLQGKVREVAGGPGGRPRAILVDGDEHYVMHALDPEFRTELRRLSGLIVKVNGVLGDPRAAAKDHVLVDRYEIVEVGKGVVPRVGRLAVLQVGKQSRLVFVDDEGQADLLPRGWSQKMKRHAGAKVWIVGIRGKDGSFRPQRFSILRTSSKKRAE